MSMSFNADFLRIRIVLRDVQIFPNEILINMLTSCGFREMLTLTVVINL